MKENTQEKDLIERNEDNNIFGKIKNFFRNLFGKKEIEVNNVVDEHLEMEMEKSEVFRSNIRNIEIDENNIDYTLCMLAKNQEDLEQIKNLENLKQLKKNIVDE